MLLVLVDGGRTQQLLDGFLGQRSGGPGTHAKGGLDQDEVVHEDVRLELEGPLRSRVPWGMLAVDGRDAITPRCPLAWTSSPAEGEDERDEREALDEALVPAELYLLVELLGGVGRLWVPWEVSSGAVASQRFGSGSICTL